MSGIQQDFDKKLLGVDTILCQKQTNKECQVSVGKAFIRLKLSLATKVIQGKMVIILKVFKNFLFSSISLATKSSITA